MKIVTAILFLLFSFVLVIAIIQADVQAGTPEFSVSINAPAQKSNSGEKYEKKYSTDESGTSTVLVVSNAMARLLKDDDGDEYYPKLTFKFDLDVNKTTNYYIVFYLNLYGDWFVIDETAVYTLEEGYSSEEGVWDLDLYFIAGYEPKKIKTKVEVNSENGDLLATYGPDDDPDLKDIPVEADDYDIKEDPFVTTPTPTPTPCEPNTMTVAPDTLTLTLNKKEFSEVTVTVTGADGCAVEGETVTATTNMAGNKRISISPESAETDENGQATFTIVAKKTGKTRIIFKAGDVKESIIVKVK
mgnify:FL=1